MTCSESLGSGDRDPPIHRALEKRTNMAHFSEEEIWSVDGQEFLVAALLLGIIISLIGIMGNSFVVTVISVLRKRGEKSVVQLFILHLAFSDLMVCLVCIPLVLFTNFHYPSDYRSADDVICKLARFLQFLAPSSSISILTIISIDRYLALVKPFPRRAVLRVWFFRPHWLITFAWMYSAIQFLPTVYFTKMNPLEDGNHTLYYCTTVPNNTISGSSYLVLLSLTAFVLPLGTMSVLYYRIVRLLRARQEKLSPLSPYKETKALKIFERSKNRVQRVFLTVVAVFIICWAPFVVYCAVIERFVRGFPNPMDAARLVTYSLGLSNSICNPFIYFLNVRGNRMEPVRELLTEVCSWKRKRTLVHYSNVRCSNVTNPQTLSLEVIPKDGSSKTRKASKNSEVKFALETNSGVNDFEDSEKEALWAVEIWPSLDNLCESTL